MQKNKPKRKCVLCAKKIRKRRLKYAGTCSVTCCQTFKVQRALAPPKTVWWDNETHGFSNLHIDEVSLVYRAPPGTIMRPLTNA